MGKILDSSFEKGSHSIWHTCKSCVSPVLHLQSFLPPNSSNPPPGKLEIKVIKNEKQLATSVIKYLDDTSSLDLSGEVEQAGRQVSDEGGRHLLIWNCVRHVACFDQDWHTTKLSHLDIKVYKSGQIIEWVPW